MGAVRRLWSFMLAKTEDGGLRAKSEVQRILGEKVELIEECRCWGNPVFPISDCPTWFHDFAHVLSCPGGVAANFPFSYGFENGVYWGFCWWLFVGRSRGEGESYIWRGVNH